MLFRKFVMSLILLFAVSGIAFAQNQLDPEPLDPENDPDIDMYMSSWQESRPFNSHGAMTERAILSKLKGDDPLKPHKRGAVLKYINRFSRAHIDAHATTSPVTLKGEQEIYYFLSGKGVIKAGGETSEVRNGIFVLMPEGLEFTIVNTGDELLTMYLINEPTHKGFRPNEKMLVKDEKAMPLRNQGYITRGFHWHHNGMGIFTTADGLSELEAVTLHTYNAMTIGQPHSHEVGVEEVFTVAEGKNCAFLGKEIRWQMPGMAYLIPPNGRTPHANINTTEMPVKSLYFARYADHETRP